MMTATQAERLVRKITEVMGQPSSDTQAKLAQDYADLCRAAGRGGLEQCVVDRSKADQFLQSAATGRDAAAPARSNYRPEFPAGGGMAQLLPGSSIAVERSVLRQICPPAQFRLWQRHRQRPSVLPAITGVAVMKRDDEGALVNSGASSPA